MRFGPADLRAVEIVAPALAAIGTPLRVAPSPAARQEQLIGHRRKQRRQHRPAVDDQRHRHRPVGAAGEIGARAVDRIDDPDLPAASRAGSSSVSSDSQP